MGQKTYLINDSQETDRSEFILRVKEQADKIKSMSGDFSTNNYGFGLEREYYVVDEQLNLSRCDEWMFDEQVCQRELGVHNIELACDPDSSILGEDGIIQSLRDNHKSVEESLCNKKLAREGCISVSPKDCGMSDYLSDCDTSGEYLIHENMVKNPYYLLLNHDLSMDSNKSLSNPRVSYQRKGLMPVSLTTSIQPHIQIPRVEKTASYFSSALRVCGPVLSISTNSPYLPPSMYAEEPSTNPFTHENRVVIQNDLLNNRDRRGSRFPKDVESFEEMVERISNHELFMPILSEDAPSVEWDEGFYEFNHQQRTTWWWVNPRIGRSVDDGSKSVRIELRPFPTQPTFRDNASLFALLAGAIVEIAESNHPVLDMEWKLAESNFNSALSDGPNAELSWIDRDGNRVADNSDIIQDIIECARLGLERIESKDSDIESVLEPMAGRGVYSPSEWKSERYGEYLEKGYEFETALSMTSQDYFDACDRGNIFCEWDR